MSVRRLLPRLPRSRRDARLVARTVRLVLGIPTYAVGALVAAALALSGFVLSQNVALIRDTVLGGSLPLDARLTILAEQYPFVSTGYGPVAGLFLLAVAVLVGVAVAVVAYHLREHGLSLREGGAGSAGGTVGVLLGALGAGCAACGSAVLVGVLSLAGGSGLLLFFPLEGLEFTLLALVPLGLSLYWLAEGLRGGEIRGCPVDVPPPDGSPARN
ncbi:hypothetical protein [Halorarum halobium]|uniref:hypothetical protein n=1 Tax=Halorarum halobium TaxID=3075121 RepID=UPI0028B017A4|nr:hypothetical protein [Halobaculum sp. XH14]